MKNKQGYETTDATKSAPPIEVTLNIDHVISRTFDMSINVTQLESGEIEVKDTGGIRLHLLNKLDHKGLWTYFNIRLDQYGR